MTELFNGQQHRHEILDKIRIFAGHYFFVKNLNKSLYLKVFLNITLFQLATVLGLVVCVLGDGHAISEQNVQVHHVKKEHHGHHGDLGHIGNRAPEHHEEYVRISY